MRSYKVISLAVTGKGNKIYTTGDIVTEYQFPPGNAENNVLKGHLERLGDDAEVTTYDEPALKTISPTSDTVIYTCNFGGYDEVKPIEADCDCLLFSDKPVTVKGWTNIVVRFPGSPRRASRYLKINSCLLPYKMSIYIDARIEFNGSVTSGDFLTDQIMAYRHFSRSCVYAEAEEVLRLKLDVPGAVNQQMQRYRGEGYPENNGLFENGFLVRPNNVKTKEFEQLWWKEYKDGSQRDQLSMVYALWKSGQEAKAMPDAVNLRKSGLFTLRTRKKKRWSFGTSSQQITPPKW